jgi:hypothetical protein
MIMPDVKNADRRRLGRRDADRASRIARLVRFNESIAIAGHSLAEVGRRPRFACECGGLDCRGIVQLALAEYERIRGTCRLLLLVGHEAG